MTNQIKEWAKSVNERFLPDLEKIVEIGGLDINGSVRDIFDNGKNYFSTDMQAGNGVDLVINSHKIYTQKNRASVDMVICLEMLEHDDRPWETLRNINGILKNGGYFLVSAPTLGFPYHAYPKDYWRFTKDSFEDVILKGFEIIEIIEVKDNAGYPTLCALGKKK
ncbi:MAG TPA: methyltransferase domain-containing protein [Candidatus Cloacimonas sp.]|nr:methyltransferase domain-containing protein [Candidatus Cloacimonas sp.]HPS60781.1 methyltransferase domain-containing protein [Candidatus Cloacimonas sp.]